MISLPYKVETKIPIKIDGWNHHLEDKREDKKKFKKCTTNKNQRKERANASRGKILFTPPLMLPF